MVTLKPIWDTSKELHRLFPAACNTVLEMVITRAFDALLRERALTMFVMLEAVDVFMIEPLQTMHALPILGSRVLEIAIVIVALVVTSDEPRAQGLLLISALIEALSWFVRVEAQSTRRWRLGWRAESCSSARSASCRSVRVCQ
jgi:hypothetical protein